MNYEVNFLMWKIDLPTPIRQRAPQFVYPKYCKHSNESSTFLFLGRLGCFMTILKIAFLIKYFHGQNMYKIRVSVQCIKKMNNRNEAMGKC